MARILITSGPTRQYLDPVRYLTNASSGRMGRALAEAGLARGHEIVIVSGPVEVGYPEAAEVVWVTSTEEMLGEGRRLFAECDGLIGAAAPCDYRPVRVETQKIQKTGQPLELHLVETPDIVATLGAERRSEQWLVGFALETQDSRFRAIVKMQKKQCRLMVVNGPSAMNAEDNAIEILDPAGDVISRFAGAKRAAADAIFDAIETQILARQG
ncbi:MAG TPA: phosphopantothenoylcysteine decarboxylase [Pirellulaceae bacterium]|nr:phosphopantothenoylcysteine decarboxylase [Pirellulaceae bacterium]